MQIHAQLLFGKKDSLTNLTTEPYLFGFCNAFKCQPFDDIKSLTSKMSTIFEPNATIVMSGLPMMNNSGISSTLHRH